MVTFETYNVNDDLMKRCHFEKNFLAALFYFHKVEDFVTISHFVTYVHFYARKAGASSDKIHEITFLC
jgi:hypothetical protein